MTDAPVTLSGGLPETVLPEAPAPVLDRLRSALSVPPDLRRAAVAEVVRDNPSLLEGWASMGDLARDDVEAYACYRVGYHRGLDSLRASGWRGSGFVRWSHEPNRGFLRSLAGLRRAAAAIGEWDEERRCREFLHQLDPAWEQE